MKRAGAGVNAPPSSYTVDGKQYVALAGGQGRVGGQGGTGGRGGTPVPPKLLVFTLDGKAQ